MCLAPRARRWPPTRAALPAPPPTQQKVPPGYDATYKHYAAQGARVIALARRRLPPGLSGPELRGLARGEVEGDMEFEGFAVFQVGHRPGSTRFALGTGAASAAAGAFIRAAPDKQSASRPCARPLLRRRPCLRHTVTPPVPAQGGV